MTRETTPGQQQVLEFIQRTIRDSGTSPTLGEIAEEFRKSTGAIQTTLKALQSKGYIEIVPKKSRGIRLTELSAAQEIRVTELRAALEAVLEGGSELPALFRAAQESLPKVFRMQEGTLWVRDASRRRFLGPRDFGLEACQAFRDELPIRLQGRPEPLFVLDRKKVPETPISALVDERARSFLLIPIRDLEQELGLLAFLSGEPQKESEETIEAAGETSALLSLPIRRAAAQFGLQEDLKLHRLLLGLVKEIAGELDLQSLLRRIFGQIERLMPVDAMWIATRKPDGTYEAILETDLDDKNRRVFFPVPRIMEPDQSKVLMTVEQRRYVLVNRSAEEMQRLQGRVAKGDPWFTVGNPNRRSASLVFVPIWFGKDWNGAMSVQSYTMNAYRHEDAERLQMIGEYIGLAIRNAQYVSAKKRV